MPENNSSTDTAAALAELLDRTEILEQKMQKNIDETRKISSNMKSMIEMLRDMETRLDDWLGVPHLAEKPPLEQIFSPPLLPTPGSTTMIHVEIPSRHQQQVLHNYTTEPTDSTIVTQVRLCKPVFPTFHGDDANSFEITAQNMKLISKSEFLVLGCSDSFCIQGVRQNDCEKLNLFLPLEKPSAKFATAMKETDTNYKVLVDVYGSVKTGWIWFEEPPSLRDDTRHLRTDSNDADMMEPIGSRESLKKNIQVGYYFSYNNLSRDNFLKKTVPKSEYGIVSMSLICMFPRMGGHLAVWDVKVDEKAVELVADTLISSTSLENFEDDKKVGRVTEFTNREEVIEQVNNRTVATAPLPYDAKAEDSESFFCQLAKVNSIGLTKHVAGKKMFSGTVLIEFSSDKEAEYVLKLNLSVAS